MTGNDQVFLQGNEARVAARARRLDNDFPCQDTSHNEQ